MKLELGNRILLSEYNADQRKRIKQKYTFDNPAYAEALKQGRSTWAIDPSICLYEESFALGYKTLSLPVGCLDYLVNTFEPLIIDQRITKPVTIPFDGSLRPYQQRLVRQAMAHTHGILVAATGSGKTICAIALAARLGQRTLVLVKNKALAQQWCEAIQKFTGLAAGLMGGGKMFEGKQFSVGMVQTLYKRDLNALRYGLVVADECHNLPARQAYTVINGLYAHYKFGLSATPQRRDHLEFMLHGALGDIVATINANELADNVLPVSVRPLRVRYEGTPKTWQEFLNSLVSNEQRNRLIVETAKKFAKRVGTIILCSHIRHCERLENLAHAAGLSALVLHGQLTSKERGIRMAQAPHAALIIGTLSLLSEGIDLPHLGVLIFAAPVSADTTDKDAPASTRLLQSIGRCRRPYPNKQRAIVVDIVDEHNQFGYSTYNKRKYIYQQQGFVIEHL